MMAFAASGLSAAPQEAEPLPQQDVQDAIEVLYADQIQKDVQLTDTQLPRIAPLVKRWVRMRIEAPARRNQAMNEWNQAIERGAPPEEIRRLKEAYDNTDPARLRQQFLSQVDQILTPQQQQRLRRSLPQADQRIQRMLDQNRRQIEERRKAQEELRQKREAQRPPQRPPIRPQVRPQTPPPGRPR
jgi:hypothetical protein